MLDKLKLFNSKGKTTERSKGVPSSKRTSSSSGFSSARSERSDSSTSLCSEPKTTFSSDVKDISPCSVSSTSSSSHSNTPTSAPAKTPSLKKIGGISVNKSTLGKAKSGDGGKESVSNKPEHTKSNSGIPRERKSERIVKDPEDSSTPKSVDKQHTYDSLSRSNVKTPRIGSLSNDSNTTQCNKQKDEVSYTKIEPDNPIRQSKVVGNLKDQLSQRTPNNTGSSFAPKTESSSADIVHVQTIAVSSNTAVKMENSGMSQGATNILVAPSGSSIPKPTAAVKGTSKVTKEDKHNLTNSSNNMTSMGNTSKPNNQENSQVGTKLPREDIYVAVQIAGPDTQVLDTGQGQDNQIEQRTSNLPKSDRSRTERSGVSNQSGVSIAMVSPIMSSSHRKDKQQVETDSSSGSIYRNQSNNSVIKPNYEISTSLPSHYPVRGQPEPLYETCDKLTSRDNANVINNDAAAIGEEGDDVVLNIKPMQPLLRSSPYGYMRSLGPLSSQHSAVSPRMHSSLRIQSDYGETGRLSSSRQFLASLDTVRMYGMAMKRAMSGYSGLVDGDYASDIDQFDFASGYLSDGEILKPGMSCRADDINSGYLSEGGTPVYTKKSVIKQKDNQKKDLSSKAINILQDDRSRAHSQRHFLRLGFDDSSSISSGVSDTFPEFSTDENLTGSSLSSDTNAYGSLKRNPRNGTGYTIVSSTSASAAKPTPTSATEKNRKTGDEHSGHSSSTSNSHAKTKQAHVKKTDSSMQTDSSAFHHVSSSTWKKYLQQQQQQDSNYQGKSDSKSDKAKERKGGKADGSGKKASSDKSDNHKPSKHKLVVIRSAESERHRAETDSGDAKGGLQRGSAGRSSSPKSSRGSCESLPTSASGNVRIVAQGENSKKSSSSRTGTSGTSSFKRPTQGNVSQTSNTAYLACNGGSKSGSISSPSGSAKSNTKRSSAEKLADVGRAPAFPCDEISNKEVSPDVPRQTPGTPGNNSKTTLERKGKVKVCANTQTTGDLSSGGVHSDSEYSSLTRKYPPKQYFMTTPGPGTGLKERVYGSRSILNGSPTPPLSDYVMMSARAPRLSAPLRDMDNYASLEHGATGHFSWLRHSSSCGTSVTSSGAGGNRSLVGATLTEADSMESLSSTSSSIHAQIQQARANSLTHARLMLHQRELAASPRLSRSNSIRSTKSEKLYSSYMLQRSSEDAESCANSSNGGCHGNGNASNASQPTSPSSAPQGSNRYMFPLSPGAPSLPTSGGSSLNTNGRSSMSPYMTGLLSKMTSKDDDIHGSALSLVSTSSSIYSTAEEKQAHEIRKLKRELDQAHEKVATLTSQLTTNAHMVAAFEQSLSNMTSRLQHLTASAEQKDSELTELRKTIEALKQQSAEAGLTKVALQSMQAVQRTLQEHRISRQFSTDSMSSVNSFSSACSGNSGQSGDVLNSKKKKKKGWLRSSFSKAFSRSKKNKNGSVSDVEDVRQLQSDSSTPNSPLLGSAHTNGASLNEPMKQSHSSSALYEKDDESAPEVVKELKKQLREKDMILTDIRLDALSSAHQLESLKETVNKMRNEMLSLKNDNDRLQRLVSSKSLTSSQSSLPQRNSVESLEKRLSASENSGEPSIDVFMDEFKTDQDGKLVTVSVYLGCHGDSSLFQKKTVPLQEVLVGSISVSSKTKWDMLDNLVKRVFKEYVLRVDPVSNLGLSAESVVSYHVGEIVRSKESEVPELLPCGYIVGDNMHIKLVLKGTKQHSVDALAFESLIPKAIVQRYVSLLTEHRRIILCGPSGTGKTYIAQKLAEYLVLKNGKELTAGSIATFSVDHKSAKELRQYLSNVAEQCETSSASDLPTVIILDNLHHVGSLGEVFNGFLSAKYQKCPYIIGTMNQATCSTTNLQLHHNFRWVLCANHMEPVKGFLGRYLKRKLVEEEVKNGTRNPDVAKVIDWMPKVWQHLNKYLETHSSSDVTIGPRLFLSCPVDVASSQVWFTDLWNYSIVPYLLEAVREGLQLYGRRAPWEDPAEWVHQTYPWPSQGSGDWPQLLKLRPEDVGYEGHPGPGMGSKSHHSSGTSAEADPLLNMLMRLQEAASYSSPHSNDSDSTSMDSHSSGIHSDELLTSGLESTL